MENILDLLKGSGRATDEKSEFMPAECTVLSLGHPKEYKAKTGKTVSRTALRIKGYDETFYTFSDSIINAPEFIPTAGVKAIVLIKPNTYTDSEGKEQNKHDIRKCTFDTTKGLTDHDLEKLAKFGIAFKA